MVTLRVDPKQQEETKSEDDDYKPLPKNVAPIIINELKSLDPDDDDDELLGSHENSMNQPQQKKPKPAPQNGKPQITDMILQQQARQWRPQMEHLVNLIHHLKELHNS
ncbi:hypothetical protein Cantr_05825 [Candida viswanathii]|uniref:Uncharacterized protein n=1 Tax=Candida viswanathii TaxID=5486 RepID=A0A367XS38_9ASCO|nr:hypothetical protein Cantr_05825 [Candida viswanathii]